MSSSSSDTENDGTALRRPQRGSRGRFVSVLPQSSSASRRRVQQKTYLERKKRLKDALLDDFLACMVVRGTSRDSISALRSGNTMAKIYEGVVKQCSRHGPNIRCAALREFYISGEFLRSSSSSSITGSPPSLPKRPKSYVGCRLPKVINKREMFKLKKWITTVREAKALTYDTVDEAFEFCKRVFTEEATSRTRQTRPVIDAEHIGNPRSLRGSSSSLSNGTSAAPAAIDHILTESPFSGNSRLRTRLESSEAEGMQRASQSVEASRNLSSHEQTSARLSRIGELNNAQSGPDDEKKAERAKMLLRIAKDDDYYAMVHLALDEGMDWEFGIFSQMVLDEWKSEGLQQLNLLNNILIFAHENRCGPSNIEEHERRKAAIKVTAELLDMTRQMISTDDKRYPLYKDMTWRFQLP